jgi:hypothetical protein
MAGYRTLTLVADVPDPRHDDHGGEQARLLRIGTLCCMRPGTAKRSETLEGEAHNPVIERAAYRRILRTGY